MKKNVEIKAKMLCVASGEELAEILKSYDVNSITVAPCTEKKLYQMYHNNTDAVVNYIRKLTEDNVFVIGNEVRAMLGHLADYRLNPSSRKNLSDAYGHFRRLNIDAFKILCNEFDKVFFKYLMKHYHYDFRNVHKDFLCDYAEKYFIAKNLYLKAQVEEHAGSDSVTNNDIIKLYYDATAKYCELLVFFQENNKGIEKTRCCTIVRVIGSVAALILGLLLSILTI